MYADDPPGSPMRSPMRRRTALIERSANTPEPRGLGGQKSSAKLAFGRSPLAGLYADAATAQQQQENAGRPEPQRGSREEPDSWDEAHAQSGSPLLMTLSPPSANVAHTNAGCLDFGLEPSAPPEVEQPEIEEQADESAALEDAAVLHAPEIEDQADEAAAVEDAAVLHAPCASATEAEPGADSEEQAEPALEIGQAEAELEAEFVDDAAQPYEAEGPSFEEEEESAPLYLDDDSAVLQELLCKLVNAQEDSVAWQNEHDRILNEGRALYVGYATKCERLKHLRTELDQACAAHGAEREAHSVERARRLAEREAHGAERARLQAEVGEHSAERAWLLAEVAEHGAERARLQAEVGEHGAERARLQAEVGELQEQIQELSRQAQAAPPAISESVHRTMEATDGLSAECLSQKLEATIISNELLRAEVVRQAAEAKREAHAAELRQEQLQRAHAAQLASQEEAAAGVRAQLGAARVESAQLGETLVEQQSHIQTLLQVPGRP